MLKEGYVELSSKVFTVILLTVLVLILLTTTNALTTNHNEVTTALIVSITPPWDTIDEGVRECIDAALTEAEENGYALIMLIDSYGGYLDAGFNIADRIALAKAPVIAYVSGGKALSAATLIILPSHIIAVSPQAVIGAMQPISYDPMTGTYRFVNESKIINPIVEKAINYAKQRYRNTTAAELFVRKNLVLNSESAVKYHVADLVANNLDDLLNKLRGKVINIDGKNVTLNIVSTKEFTCSIRSRVISAFSNPLVNSIMMTIGVLGTIFALLSGKLPIVPLTLLLTGFNPNLISLFMILLGGILLAVELFATPGFGILGITGIVFLAIGFALMPSAPSGFAPPPAYLEQFRIIAVGIASGLGAFTGFAVYKIVEAKRRESKYFTPIERIGHAVDNIKPGSEGFVIVNGEYWRAISDEFIPKGSKVKVVRMEGARLVVKKVED
ncbi:MAG: serine protease [Desulfurococcales archaeon ex4484_42]|nr:MAG: serine protease [Desulfurococcales archaeon ex4484_42]